MYHFLTSDAVRRERDYVGWRGGVANAAGVGAVAAERPCNYTQENILEKLFIKCTYLQWYKFCAALTLLSFAELLLLLLPARVSLLRRPSHPAIDDEEQAPHIGDDSERDEK